MPRCVVKTCVYNKSVNCVRDKAFLHLFRFPRNVERWEAWRKVLNLKKDDIFTRSLVCQLHFRKESYDHEKSPFSLHLKSDAVPTESQNTSEVHIKSESPISLEDSKPSSTDVHMNVSDAIARPSTSAGFYEQNRSHELPQKSHISLEFVKCETRPLSPIPRSNLKNVPQKQKLRKRLSDARKEIKRLRSSLSHFKKRAARLADMIEALQRRVNDETLEQILWFCRRWS